MVNQNFHFIKKFQNKTVLPVIQKLQTGFNDVLFRNFTIHIY